MNLEKAIMKHLNGDTKHYARYFPGWKQNAPIALFWNWGGYKQVDCEPDYLTHKNLFSISNDN